MVCFFPTGKPSIACVPTSSPHSGSHRAFLERTFPHVNRRQETPGLQPALGPQHRSSGPQRLPFPLPSGGPSIPPHACYPYSLILRKASPSKGRHRRYHFPSRSPVFNSFHASLWTHPFPPRVPLIEFSSVLHHPLCFQRLPVNSDLTLPVLCPVNLS